MSYVRVSIEIEQYLIQYTGVVVYGSYKGTSEKQVIGAARDWQLAPVVHASLVICRQENLRPSLS